MEVFSIVHSVTADDEYADERGGKARTTAFEASGVVEAGSQGALA